MWDQMTQEMAALAEDKNQEEVVREELFTWMGQVPSVLQDVLPKLSGISKSLFLSSSIGVKLPQILIFVLIKLVGCQE